VPGRGAGAARMLYDAIKRLTKHSLIYALGPMLHKAAGFVLLYWVSRWIGNTENYGVVEIATVTIVVAGQVLGLNLLSGMTRYFFDYESKEDRRTVVTTTLLMLLASTGSALLLAVVFDETLARLLFEDVQYADALVALAAILFCQTIGLVGLRYMQVLQRSVAYGVVTTAKVVIEIGSKVYLMGILGLTYMGVLYSVLVGEALLAIGTIVYLGVRVGLRFSAPMARRLLRFSYPLILSGLCMFALHQADRMIVQYLINKSETGVYGMAYKFGSLPNLILLEAFGLIWFPYIFSLKSGEQVRLICRKVLTYFSFLMCFASLAVGLFQAELFHVMVDPKFWRGQPAIPVILLGYVFWAVYQVASTTFYLREKTAFVSLLMAAAALFNVALNFLLVPSLGFMGAAWATLATFAVLAVAAWILAERVEPTRYELGRVLLPILLACGLYGASLLLPADPLVVTLTAKTLLWLAFPFLLVLGGFLTPEERDRLAAIVGGVRQRVSR
jgi:O-antigen/teichoic acid export membrane protein